MLKLVSSNLCASLLRLAFLSMCLVLALGSNTTVRAQTDFGACYGCDTALNNCYASCDQSSPPPSNDNARCHQNCQSNPSAFGSPGWVQCVSTNCLGSAPSGILRDPCNATYNTTWRDCNAGSVAFSWQNSYDACIAQGSTVSTCCDTIAEMAYDRCCTNNVCQQ